MELHFLDWSIIAALLILMTSAAIYTKRYNNTVADFLAANRTAGRYMICIAEGMSGLGAITIVMMFEIFYRTGFPLIWWDMGRLMIIPAILSLSGWIIYRFRQTRSLTLAQFFEVRYSKKFRVFCGILIWVSGIINFGIFPAVGARFFMHFLGVEETTTLYIFFMLGLLSISLFFTFMGGQIAVMVTDFIQGVFCNVIFIVIIIVVLFMFKWDNITEVLLQAPENASKINPFKVTQNDTFDLWFFMILAATAAYGFLSWQGTQGYNAAARNPHEARMGKSLSVWRMITQNLFVIVLPVCALTFMTHPSFAEQAKPAHAFLSTITNETIRGQITPTVAFRYFLPMGIQGGLIAVMLAAFISTHDTYLHSWGSIFIQDVVLPFRKKPLEQKQHMRLLKWSIFGVAVFIFFFSLFFRQNEAIIIFFQITGAIFIGGAGSVIIGGLYWKRGTTAGAWAGMITGSSLAVTSIALRQINEYHPLTNKVVTFILSYNSVILSFWSALAAIIMYIVVSLLSGKRDFNLDKMLHRGEYAVEEDKIQVTVEPISRIKRLIGINADFNKKDQIIYMAMVLWTLGLVVMFLTMTAANFVFELTDNFWLTYWKYYIWVSLVLGLISTIWFTIGGLCDIKKMFSLLNTKTEDSQDDGTVVNDSQDQK